MKVALVTIAKDEDNYIDEWILYNLKLGFDDIFLFLNNWRYNRNIISDKLHLIPFDGSKMLNPCYNSFINKMYGMYDFAAFFDIDEFLVLKNNMTLHSWLSNFTDVGDIYINWRLFGDNNYKEVIDNEYSVLKRFTKCKKTLSQLGKNIINLKLVKNRLHFYNPHIVVTLQNNMACPYIYFDTNKNLFTYRPWMKENDIEQVVELYHYRNKTYQECYNRKFGKEEVFFGDGQWTDINRFNTEFDNHNYNEIENTLARDFLYL